MISHMYLEPQTYVGCLLKIKKEQKKPIGQMPELRSSRHKL